MAQREINGISLHVDAVTALDRTSLWDTARSRDLTARPRRPGAG